PAVPADEAVGGGLGVDRGAPLDLVGGAEALELVLDLRDERAALGRANAVARRPLPAADLVGVDVDRGVAAALDRDGDAERAPAVAVDERLPARVHLERHGATPSPRRPAAQAGSRPPRAPHPRGGPGPSAA